jgi:hypothetical protein
MKFSRCFSVFTILGALTLSVPAWADIPPEDVCSASNVGEDCSNALVPTTQGTGPGVCQPAMCTRATPDGPMTYSCYRCMPADDGGGGGQANEAGGAEAGVNAGSSSSAGAGANTAGTKSSSSAGAGANTAGTKSSSSAGAANSKSGSDDGGCSLSQAPGAASGLWATLIALGLTFAGIRRRRSLTS